MAGIFDADFLRGFHLGKAFYANLLRAAKGEPVAYLYNGVRLPKLPEWDKTAYPYAVLYETDTSYYLYCFAEAKQATLTGGVSCWGYGCAFGLSDGVWNPRTALLTGSYTTFWANYDVYDSDGTLYMSASEPVPVYE